MSEINPYHAPLRTNRTASLLRCYVVLIVKTALWVTPAFFAFVLFYYSIYPRSSQDYRKAIGNVMALNSIDAVLVFCAPCGYMGWTIGRAIRFFEREESVDF